VALLLALFQAVHASFSSHSAPVQELEFQARFFADDLGRVQEFLGAHLRSWLDFVSVCPEALLTLLQPHSGLRSFDAPLLLRESVKHLWTQENRLSHYLLHCAAVKKLDRFRLLRKQWSAMSQCGA
jgi:hypothetical protein